MKTLLISVLVASATFSTGCGQQAESHATRDEAAAKARADALKKEMDTAPKVFTNRDPFKKNEPTKADVKRPPAPETKP